ncbi:SCP-like protein [Ancylostoma ceylanicum]|uniref:SCP-like protein n=1 Tax=Ancylostoma ceylanicum TaxID=53326 RepID=A0A0D6LMW6_9BILA|nr:SCP-like protein [Ancylostoma ceylanicum]
MDDGTRLSIMEKHNKYRSLLALGLLKTKKGYAHSASKMRQLDYDCVVEKSAYESAKKCSPTASSSGKYDENLYVIKDGSDVIKAIDSWWNEVYTLQMNEKEQKKTKNKYNSSSGIPNFANMAWDTHQKLGCAVAKCSRETQVVCQYAPKARKEDRRIYKMGAFCERCSEYGDAASGCNPRTGLCVYDFN